MGRPKKDIDPEIVERLAQRFCSVRTIAAVVGCDEKTIRTRFPAELAKGREEGKSKLREWQWKAAENGNTTMQIWLGKQVLGQTDKREITKKITADIRIAIREAAVLRIELAKDPQYLDYLRARTGKGNGQPRLVGPDSQPVVGDGSAPGDGRSSPDGDGDGQG